MSRRLVDISVPLESGIKSDPEFMLPKITYHAHEETAQDLCGMFPGMTPDLLPEGMGWAIEEIERCLLDVETSGDTADPIYSPSVVCSARGAEYLCE